MSPGTLPGLHGAPVCDRDGLPVGAVVDLLVDAATLRPAWYLVALDDGRRVVAPAGGARHGVHATRLACRAGDVLSCPADVPSLETCRHFGVRAAVSALAAVRAA